MRTPKASMGSGFAAAADVAKSIDLTGKAAVMIGGYSDISVEKGWKRYGSAGLLVSSADRGWSGLSAELRCHRKGVIAWKGLQSDTEICVDVCGNGSLVTRRAAGIKDRRVASRGTIWLSPPGLQEGSVDIAEDLPEFCIFIFHCASSPRATSVSAATSQGLTC